MAVFEPHQVLFHLTLVQQLHAQTMQNGYYFTNRENMSDADFVSVENHIVNFFNLFILSAIKQIQSQEVVHRSLVVSQLIPANGPISETILETSQGDQAIESLPSYCAAVLTLRSGFGGKSNRGRSYYAGVGEGFTAGSRLDGSTLTGLQNIGNQLLAIFGDASFNSPASYCIFSRKLGTNEGGSLNASGIRVVKQTIARSILGTQRHRKIGIGN